MASSITSAARPLVRIAFNHATFIGIPLLWMASVMILRALGLRAAVPWDLVALITVRVLPFAVVVLFAARALARKGVTWPLPTALGFASIALFPAIGAWAVLALPASLLCFAAVDRRTIIRIAGAVVVMALGYAAVWNANYLCAYLAADRLNDALLLKAELALFRALGLSADAGVYPIAPGGMNILFESAYVMLFPQVVLTTVAMAIHKRGELLSVYIRAIFVAYALGLLVFLAFPTVGPTVTAPELIKSEYRSSITAHVAQRTAEELEAVHSGGDLNGIGYFIALPSLHVAQVCIAAFFLRRIRVLWCWFLPINVAIVLSTVLLGMHYIVDIPAGMLVAAVAVALARASSHARDLRLSRPDAAPALFPA